MTVSFFNLFKAEFLKIEKAKVFGATIFPVVALNIVVVLNLLLQPDLIALYVTGDYLEALIPNWVVFVLPFSSIYLVSTFWCCEVRLNAWKRMNTLPINIDLLLCVKLLLLFVLFSLQIAFIFSAGVVIDLYIHPDIDLLIQSFGDITHDYILLPVFSLALIILLSTAKMFLKNSLVLIGAMLPLVILHIVGKGHSLSVLNPFSFPYSGTYYSDRALMIGMMSCLLLVTSRFLFRRLIKQ